MNKIKVFLGIVCGASPFLVVQMYHAWDYGIVGASLASFFMAILGYNIIDEIEVKG